LHYSELTDTQLLELLASYGGKRRAMARGEGWSWSGSLHRRLARLANDEPYTNFGNTGPDAQRFSNEKTIEEIDLAYRELTDRCEYALDIEIILQTADYYNVVCAGDVHLGVPECAYGPWTTLCNWTLEQPDAGMIFHGDGGNVSTVGSPSSPAVDLLPFEKQFRLLAYNLTPLAEAGKLLLLLEGNHEDRIRRATGLKASPMQRVAQELDVPYRGYETFVRWRIMKGEKSEVYTGYHHHGRGAARTEGGILNNLIAMAKLNRADYLAAGHTHHLFAHTLTWREVAADGEVVVRKEPVLNTGSFQRTQGDTYATRNAFTPAVIGAGSLHLYGTKHSVHART